VPLHVIHADMRSFRLPEQVDLVLCEFDALNHIPREADLAQVARSVARALRPGGHFFFDVNNRDAFRKVWARGTMWLEIPGVVLVMRGSYDAKRNRGVTECEWFLREGALWRRHTETVEQVCWTQAEVRRTLRAAGFDQVRTWDATPFFKGAARIEPGCRTFYRARKSAS
jgi:SAM-dependent methyltransferase